jgi:antitoxin YefM
MLPLNEIKAKFSEMVGRARDHHEEIVILVHGEPAAVLVSVYEWESMKETLDILGDPEAMQNIATAEAERGQEISASQVHQELAEKYHASRSAV